MRKLRTNTARTFSIGPFVLDTDGKTPQTGLTIAASDIKLIKNGAASVNSSATGRTHLVNGMYTITLPASDLNFLGDLMISVKVTNALSVWHEFLVMNTGAYDMDFGADYTAELKIKSLSIVNPSGDAVTINGGTALTVLGHGINVLSNNGDAIRATTNNGSAIFGAATNAPALYLVGSNDHAAKFSAGGGGNGLYLTSTSANGLLAESSSNGNGILAKSGTGGGNGVQVIGGDTGGCGMLVQGKKSYGLKVEANGGSYHDAICAMATGSGNGIFAYGGSSGGHGIAAQGINGGNALNLDGTLDIKAKEISALQTEVGKVVTKLPTVGYIAGLNDVLAVKNNTTFTTTMPDNAKMPKTGKFSFFVKSYIYDNAGEMELTKYGLGVRCRGADGRDLNGRLFKDKAMTLPAVSHPQYGASGYVIAVPSGTQSGVFELYYESKAYDAANGVFSEQITTEFMYQEDSSGITRYFGRSTMLILPDAGDATLADTSANMGVIAKAIRGYDSQSIMQVSGSIEKRITDDIDTIPKTVLTNGLTGNILDVIQQYTENINSDMGIILPQATRIENAVNDIHTDVGSMVSKIDLIKAVTDALAIEVNKIVLKLPIGTDLISSLTLQTMNAKGISLSDSVDTVFAALRGRMDKDGTLLTFYGRDGSPLYRVNVATTGRTPI